MLKYNFVQVSEFDKYKDFMKIIKTQMKKKQE